MTIYNFRLRFNFPSAYHIDADEDKLELLTLPSGEVITLCSGIHDSPIKDHNQAAVVGGPFSSTEQAMAAAEKSKRALLYWVVEDRAGIDFGNGKQRGGVTDIGLKYFEQRFKVPCRNDIHGIDVYESVENLRFVGVHADAKVGKNPLRLKTTFQREYITGRRFTEKQVLASEIYASSFFDVTPRARFITLVTAIEALLDQPLRSEETQKLVTILISNAERSIIDADTKRSLIQGIGNLRRQSIGQAGRSLVKHLLPDEKIDGLSSVQFFDRCYDYRSQILHLGTVRDKSVDIADLANMAEPFVNRILIASLNDQPQQT